MILRWRAVSAKGTNQACFSRQIDRYVVDIGSSYLRPMSQHILRQLEQRTSPVHRKNLYRVTGLYGPAAHVRLPIVPRLQAAFSLVLLLMPNPKVSAIAPAEPGVYISLPASASLDMGAVGGGKAIALCGRVSDQLTLLHNLLTGASRIANTGLRILKLRPGIDRRPCYNPAAEGPRATPTENHRRYRAAALQ
jgi:hypothetical protein